MLLNKDEFSEGQEIVIKLFILNEEEKTHIVYILNICWKIDLSFIKQGEMVKSIIIPEESILPAITKHEIQLKIKLELVNYTRIAGIYLSSGEYSVKASIRQYDPSSDEIMLISSEEHIMIHGHI